MLNKLYWRSNFKQNTSKAENNNNTNNKPFNKT